MATGRRALPAAECNAVEVGGAGDHEIAELVHVHGARLVRLGRLLGVDGAERTAANAMAWALLRRRRGDGHEHLLEAARSVGASGRPPVHEDTQLQGWLDRAELEPYEVDVGQLLELTQRALLAHRGAHRRSRVRWLGVATVVAVLAAGSALVPDEEPPEGQWRVEGSGIRSPDEYEINGGDPDVQTPAPVRSVNQDVARGVQLADVVLRGRTVPIMQMPVFNDFATLLAVGCTSADDQPAVCVVVVTSPESPLSELDDEALVASLPLPRHGNAITRGPPSVLRHLTIEAMTDHTLLVTATSPKVAAVRVTYADGSQVVAYRYHLGSWRGALFLALNIDVDAATVVYLDRNGQTLERRSLQTVAR